MRRTRVRWHGPDGLVARADCPDLELPAPGPDLPLAPLAVEAALQAAGAAALVGEQVTRLWCVKEAVAKALGLGLRLAAPELQVDLAPDSSLSVQLKGAAARRFADLDGQRLQVGTERLGDAVLAWAFVETRHLEPAPGSRAPWHPLCAAREARVQAPLRPGPAG